MKKGTKKILGGLGLLAITGFVITKCAQHFSKKEEQEYRNYILSEYDGYTEYVRNQKEGFRFISFNKNPSGKWMKIVSNNTLDDNGVVEYREATEHEMDMVAYAIEECLGNEEDHLPTDSFVLVTDSNGRMHYYPEYCMCFYK